LSVFYYAEKRLFLRTRVTAPGGANCCLKRQAFSCRPNLFRDFFSGFAPISRTLLAEAGCVRTPLPRIHSPSAALVRSSSNSVYSEYNTSQRILKSFCSTRSSSQYSRVTTVECRGLSFSIDSPNAVPIPSVHSVTESCNDSQKYCTDSRATFVYDARATTEHHCTGYYVPLRRQLQNISTELYKYVRLLL